MYPFTFKSFRPINSIPNCPSRLFIASSFAKLLVPYSNFILISPAPSWNFSQNHLHYSKQSAYVLQFFLYVSCFIYLVLPNYPFFKKNYNIYFSHLQLILLSSRNSPIYSLSIFHTSIFIQLQKFQSRHSVNGINFIDIKRQKFALTSRMKLI